jgi:hypothetical protein
VFLAATAAAAVIVSPRWVGTLGLSGLGLAAIAYYAVFALLLKVLNVDEAASLFRRARASMASALGNRTS